MVVPKSPDHASGRAALAMALATLLWGATFVVMRDALRGISPAGLVAARFGLATAVWALVLAARSLVAGPPRHGARAAVIAGLVSGPLTAGGYLFQSIGLTATSAGSSAFLTCTGTLAAAFFAWPILGIHPGRVLMLSIALALAGSALLGLRSDLGIGRGEAWTLLGALVYALQIVAVGRWATRGADPALLTAVQSLVTFLIVAPFCRNFRADLAALGPANVWRLGYLVLAGSVVAPWLQVLAQRSLPPGRIGLLFALEPVFALAFALTLGGERFVPRWWAGAALILLAVVIVEREASRRLPSSSRSATG